jgi:hypothetical protein
MACFAGNVGVFAGRARLGFVVMANDARALTGEHQRILAIHGEGRGTVMAVLAEGLRDHRTPHQKKDSQPGQEDQQRTEEMPRIPQQSMHCHWTFPKRCKAKQLPQCFPHCVEYLNESQQVQFDELGDVKASLQENGGNSDILGQKTQLRGWSRCWVYELPTAEFKSFFTDCRVSLHNVEKNVEKNIDS